MAIHNKPDESVFASSAKRGEVSDFPDLGRGWGVSFDQTGGIPPMEWFNFLFKRADEKFGYLLQRGLSEWSSTQTYPEGALVQYKNLTYKAKRENTNKKPDAAQSNDWQRWGFTQSELNNATLTEAGVTQLSSLIDSDDETKSATPKSVKMAYDNADARVSKSGDTMSGNLTVPNLIVNDPTNNNNFVQIGDDTKLIDVDMGHTVGLQTTDNANDAYIAYGATKKRFGFDGANFKADSGIVSQWYQADAKGHGAFAAQWQNQIAPYVVYNPNSNGDNIYYPFIKGINTNGNLYGTAFSFGYVTPGQINQFGAGVIHLIEDNGNEKIWWFNRDGKLTGDDFECQGKRLSKSHQTDYAYVETTAATWGGLKIYRNGNHMLIESNEIGGFNFIQRNNDGRNVYALSTPTKNGTLATLEDLPIERLIWQGSTDNQITVNAQVSKGVLFVLMDTPHGANANRPIWFSAPIEQCHDTRIGEYDTGGTAGDYNYVTLALLHRNGNNITITPQSDGRKPRIKKVVVFG